MPRRVGRFVLGTLVGGGFAAVALGEFSDDTWVQVIVAGLVVGLLSSWSFSQENGQRRPPKRR